MRTEPPRTFLVVLSTFLVVAHLPGAEPKPQIADLKPDISRFVGGLIPASDEFANVWLRYAPH